MRKQPTVPPVKVLVCMGLLKFMRLHSAPFHDYPIHDTLLSKRFCRVFQCPTLAAMGRPHPNSIPRVPSILAMDLATYRLMRKDISRVLPARRRIHVLKISSLIPHQGFGLWFRGSWQDLYVGDPSWLLANLKRKPRGLHQCSFNVPQHPTP